jgi:hypothetical protein
LDFMPLRSGTLLGKVVMSGGFVENMTIRCRS